MYSDLSDQPVLIHLVRADQRPIFELLPSAHALYHEQQEGLLADRLHEILARYYGH